MFKTTGSDAKTKAYRDLTKNLYLKLKGSRYVEQRLEMRRGNLTVEVVCTEEWLNAKSTPSAGRGAGGLAPRGRGGMPMAGIGRGRGAPAMGAGRGRGMLPGMTAGRGAPRPGIPSIPPVQI